MASKPLRVSAASFMPRVAVLVDDILHASLLSLPAAFHDYYIKGGKAFNYYYQHHHTEDEPTLVLTDDMDLVSTNDTCTALFEQLNTKLLGSYVYFETDRRPFTVMQIDTTDKIWIDGKGKSKVKNRVRTLSINGIGLVDVIIVDAITEATHVSETGLRYMDKTLFRADLEIVFQDRHINYKQKQAYFDTHAKGRTPERQDALTKAIYKAEKSYQRRSVSREFKGSRRSHRQ